MAPRRIDVRAVTKGPESVLRALYEYASPDAGGPCTIEYDGRPIPAREGEPLAISLLAAGIETLSRSVKFHRPRGPSCLRGNCEGCLTRIDGEPNRMACAVPSRDGRVRHAQNAFPSVQVDFMRITDWFFPKQFDHHHLMVRYGTAINEVMQGFARKMAGLGTLPEQPASVSPPEEIQCDVLVVGLGPAGLSVAEALARAGLSVLAVEEEPTVGGLVRDSMRMHELDGRSLCGAAWADTRLASVRAAGVDVRLSAAACATFDDGTIVITADRALWVRAKARVFCNGCHEAIESFGDNDLPGVYTARAVARALRYGVRLGERVLVTGHGDEERALAAALSAAGSEVVRLSPGETLLEATGVGSVSGAVVRGASSTHKIKCDVIASSAVRTPAFELAGQAGVEIVHDGERRCYAVRADEEGRNGARTGGGAGGGRVSGRSVVSAKVLLCRCEDVTLAEVEHAIESGQRDIESLKRFTGFGTGWCQGKQCLVACSRVLEEKTGTFPLAPVTPRPPLHPMPLGMLATLGDAVSVDRAGALLVEDHGAGRERSGGEGGSSS